MKRLLERRMITILKPPLIKYCAPETCNAGQLVKWNREREFLLDQIRQLEECEAWWSDSEWDWFINRCMDFWLVPKSALNR
jgi:hypothetical protein